MRYSKLLLITDFKRFEFLKTVTVPEVSGKLNPFPANKCNLNVSRQLNGFLAFLNVKQLAHHCSKHRWKQFKYHSMKNNITRVTGLQTIETLQFQHYFPVFSVGNWPNQKTNTLTDVYLFQTAFPEHVNSVSKRAVLFLWRNTHRDTTQALTCSCQFTAT